MSVIQVLPPRHRFPHPRIAAALCAILLAVSPALPSRAQAQTGATTSESGTDKAAAKANNGDAKAQSDSDAIDTAKLRQSLEAARTTYQQAMAETKPPAGSTPEEVLLRNHLLGELIASLEQTLNVADRLPEARKRVAEQEKRTSEWTAFPNPPPYSVLLLDQLRSGLESANFSAQAAAARTSLLGQETGDSEKRYKDAEVDRRQAEESLGGSVSDDQRNRLTWQRDLAALRAKGAAASLEAARRNQELAGVEAAEQRALAQLLEHQINVARKDSRLTQADLDAVVAEIDRRQAKLEKREATAQAASQRSHQALMQAQQALTAFKSAKKADNAETAQRADILERTVEVRRLEADNDTLAVDMARRARDICSWERTGWQMRWLLVNSGEADKLRDALAGVEQLSQRLESWNKYLDGEIARAPSGDDVQAQDRKTALNRDQLALATQLQSARRARIETYRSGQQAVTALLRTLSLWRQDFLDRGAHRSFQAVALDAASTIGQAVREAWQFEMFTVEDTVQVDGRAVTAARSVTLGKALDALLFLVMGYFASAWVARRMGQFSVSRLGVVAGHAKMISRWLHVVLLVLLVIAALYMVNIPLTMFAFLGGALAIGLGFGTQVLLKNLVAGVMLLVERPLKVGDLIEVGSIVGTVTNIDIRSSTIRTSSGIEILVPNATFIENNVTNWTYSNARVRRSITVGVDYAASPTRVRDLLQEVAGRHGHVMGEPAPRVLFTDFGADALMFELQYWIDYSHGSDASQVASDLRFMIESTLREAGINIPYPQRVVHLHTLPPDPPPAPAPSPAGSSVVANTPPPGALP